MTLINRSTSNHHSRPTGNHNRPMDNLNHFTGNHSTVLRQCLVMSYHSNSLSARCAGSGLHLELSEDCLSLPAEVVLQLLHMASTFLLKQPDQHLLPRNITRPSKTRIICRLTTSWTPLEGIVSLQQINRRSSRQLNWWIKPKAL